MENRIIFATGNMGKLDEIRQILPEYEIVSMKEAGVFTDIEEDGTTFEENALIKAKAIWDITGGIVMADDSGLEVDALNKEPGIYSARYLGEDTPYSVKNADIIKRLEGVKDEDRTARFVCAVACILPNGESKVVRGVVEGRIGYCEKGDNGFGYDPIFVLPDRGITTAELDMDEKNEISHRGKALRLIKKEL